MDTIQIIEYVAVVTGIIHVFLLTRGKVLAWPFGIISVGLYIYIFFLNQLYSDTFLHVVYVGLNSYGWWNWVKHRDEATVVEVSYLAHRQRILWPVLILVGALFWGYGMQQNTDASFPYGDAFTTVASLVAQYLLARRKLENWIIWIIVDIVAINIYLLKGLYPTSGLYAVYLILSVYGLLQWRRLQQKQVAD